MYRLVITSIFFISVFRSGVTMEGEFSNFIMVWLTVLMCLVYCYGVGRKVPTGTSRVLCLLPIVFLFFLLPLSLNTIHLAGGTAFFITWLTNFKLLLFVVDKGPLASEPSLSLGRFLAVACLPIEIRENPYPKPLQRAKSTQPGENPFPLSSNLNGQNKEISNFGGHKRLLIYAMKGLLLAVVVRALNYKDYLHKKVTLALHCLLIYLLLEMLLSTVEARVRALLGLEIQPHFREPLLSTSLQDFWGRRWNLIPHGHPHTPTDSLRTQPPFLRTRRRSKMGPTTGGHGHCLGVRSHCTS